MATVTVKWLASAKLLKEELLATGKNANPRRTIVINLEQLEPALRAEILDLTELTGMLLKSVVGLTPIRLRRVRTFRGGDHPVLSWKDVSLDTEPTAAGVPLLAHGIRTVTAKAETLMKEHEAATRKRDIWLSATYRGARDAIDSIVGGHGGEESFSDRLAELRELDISTLVPETYPMDFRPPKHMSLWKVLAEEAKLLERALLAAEKVAWIEERGSPHLRRATATGADCQRLYATERVCREAPGWTLDFDDEAVWRSRSCPSVAALDALDAANALGLGKAQVVWLVLDVDGCQPASNEAVVLPFYLGKYALVRIV